LCSLITKPKPRGGIAVAQRGAIPRMKEAPPMQIQDFHESAATPAEECSDPVDSSGSAGNTSALDQATHLDRFSLEVWLAGFALMWSLVVFNLVALLVWRD
jgi:hypothetical protein